jgi:hypothetical protein
VFIAIPSLAAEDKEHEKSFSQKFVEKDIEISEWFDSFAEGLDLLLVNRRLTKKKNDTQVRIENTIFFAEHERPRNETNIVADLRLPNVEQYWNLKFSTYDERQQRRQSQAEQLRRAPRPQNPGATVGFF